jgi:hypothetical protein
MAYCPEDGMKMDCVNAGISFAEYKCLVCDTLWQYDAEQECYRVISPNEQVGKQDG